MSISLSNKLKMYAAIFFFSILLINKTEFCQAYTAHTRDEAMNWVQSQVGTGLEYGWGAQNTWYQCVDLIQFYYAYLGVDVQYGNGMDYATNTPPAGWVYYPGGQPEYGDILVYGPFYISDENQNPYGHVAIYESDYVSYHQNFNNHSYVERITYRYNQISTPYWGCIRPDWNTIPKGINIGNNVDAYLINNNTDNGCWKNIGATENGVELEDNAGTANQIWQFRHTYDDTYGYIYRIQNASNGQYLTVPGGGASGTAVTCEESNDSAEQSWIITGTSGAYRLRPLCQPNCCLDIYGAYTEYGTTVQIWTNNNGGAQQFAIWRTGDEISKTEVTAVENKGIVTISWDAKAYANYYNLYIIDTNKPGDRQYCREGLTDTSVEVQLPNGSYTIYVSSGNWLRYTNSDQVELEVVGAHDFIVISSQEPTCTEDGMIVEECECGESRTTILPALGHAYEITTVPPMKDKGYTLHVCSVCGDSYKDNYTEPEMPEADGWYYVDSIPEGFSEENYEIQYRDVQEKISSTSPGSDWKQGELVRSEWVNSGSPYYVNTGDLDTSDARVLISSYFYHYCNGTSNEANYEQNSTFFHYDAIDASRVSASFYLWDGAYPVYLLYQGGGAIYCNSNGLGCNGEAGAHGNRSQAWYKMNVYQDRTQIVEYKYTKDTGWSAYTGTVKESGSYRFRPKYQITAQADAKSITAVESNPELTIEHGFVLAEGNCSEVTLDTPGRVKIVYANDASRFTLDYSGAYENSTASAYVKYYDLATEMERIIYSNPYYEP